MRDRVLLMLAGPLAFVVPALAFLARSHIPVTTEPSVLIWGGTAVIGLLFGSAAAMAKPTEESGAIRSAFFTLVLAIAAVAFVDVMIGWRWLWINVLSEPERLPKLLIMALFGLFIFAIFWALQKAVAVMLFSGALVFFGFQITSMLLPRDSTGILDQRSVDRSKPPFVYIVLDEAEGINGIRHAPGGDALADRLTDLFLKHNFRLYNRAFSRHFYSSRSIPNTINFDFTDNSWGPILRYHNNMQISSKLFQQSYDQGYKINVYATTHPSLNFCFPVASKCRMLESFNPESEYLSDFDINFSAVFNAAMEVYKDSYLMSWYTDELFLLYRVQKTDTQALDALAFPAWFDSVGDAILSDSRGHASFFHILFPHSPYIRDVECSRKPAPTMGYFLSPELALAPDEIEPAREERYGHYIAQYYCLASHLDSFLSKLDNDPAFDDATIVIHGDHGARISTGYLAGGIRSRDMISNFSALYAIKGPGIKSGLDNRKVPVQWLSTSYFKNDYEPAPPPQNVVIDTETKGRVEVRSMVDF